MAVASTAFVAADMDFVENLSAAAATSGLAAKKACRVPSKRAASADEHAPSVSLPMRFILTGLAALYAGVIWLIVRPEVFWKVWIT